MTAFHHAPKVAVASSPEPENAPASEPSTRPPDDGPAALREMHKALGEAFGRQPAEPASGDDGAAPQDAPKAAGVWAFVLNRPIRILVAVALVVAFGAWPLQTLLQAASVDAVVNS